MGSSSWYFTGDFDMNREALLDLLKEVWNRETSADEAWDLIDDLLYDTYNEGRDQGARES
jgi:hypothetical protein